jgi:predicted nucleotidyltransferase
MANQTDQETSFWDEAFPFLEKLTKKECKFLLIGNIACKYHGLRTELSEVDLLVSDNPDDMMLLFETLHELGWTSKDREVKKSDDFYLSIPVEEGCIDIISKTPGLHFPEVYERAVNVKFGKLTLKVLHREDLIRNKSLLDDPRHLDEAIELSMISSFEK